MRLSITILAALLVTACGGESAPPTAPAEPIAPAQPVQAEAPVEPASPALPPAPSDEVCAEVIVVQWQGATGATEAITRTESDARARAEELLRSIESGSAELADVARESSDARSSGARGGLLGTYSREDWPPQHEAIRERAFALQVGEISEILQAPYGWVFLRRCAAEHRHTRHILVRFAGARNAPPEITRTRDEAQALAAELRTRAAAPGADFEAIAREASEDGSRDRGGDMGWLGRGRLAPAYEASAFGLPVGSISEPVETEFGFHVIQRVQ